MCPASIQKAQIRRYEFVYSRKVFRFLILSHLQDEMVEKLAETASVSVEQTPDPLAPSSEAAVGDFAIANQPISLVAEPIVDLTSPNTSLVTGTKKKIIVQSVKTLRKRKESRNRF